MHNIYDEINFKNIIKYKRFLLTKRLKLWLKVIIKQKVYICK